MNHVLVRSYIKQASLLFCSCAVALFAFAWIRVWVVSLFDMGEFTELLDMFRQYEKFAPIGFDALATYQGRVCMTFDEPVVIFCTVVWCISRGSDVVSGELGRGTMEMILAQPISRAKLMWSHAAVAVGGLALLCLCVWGGIAVGVSLTTVAETVPKPAFEIPGLGWKLPLQFGEPIKESFPLSQRVRIGYYAAATFNLFTFGFFLLGLATLFSSLDRYRWRTVGGVMAVYMLQLVMFGLGKAAESLSWLKSLSFFNCYRPQKICLLAADGESAAPWSLVTVMPESTLPPMWYPLMLLVFGVICYAFAFRAFSRRDLPAPL